MFISPNYPATCKRSGQKSVKCARMSSNVGPLVGVVPDLRATHPIVVKPYRVRPNESWDAEARADAHHVDATAPDSSGTQVMPVRVCR